MQILKIVMEKRGCAVFSFSSPFLISSERVNECAARNSVPGFEIPGLADVAGLLSAREPDIDVIHGKLIQGCGSLMTTVSNGEFRAFFAEILALLEEQGSRVYLQAVKMDAAFADDEFFALPLLAADFYRSAAEKFAGGNIYALFESRITLSQAWEFVEELNMPEILKKYFSGFCAEDSLFDDKSAALKKILPNISE